MASDMFQGFARGWFVVAYAHEVAPGAAVPLRYFGRDLVLWRGESGALHALDAFCPHLGAHLGVGGTVAGEDIRCPFHAWEFDGAGACTKIPYASKIPRQARLDPWPVLERNGLIFLWHARDGAAPDYEPPALAELSDPQWLPWDGDRITVKTQPREIVENVADKAHFAPVHGTHVETFENEYIDHMAIQRTAGVAYPRGGGRDVFELTATYYGPGYQISVMEGYLSSRLMLAHTPIDEHTLHLRFGVSLKVAGDRARSEGFSRMYVENLRTGFHEDIAIWENKRYRSRPVMCEGDGPIGRLRAWYRQFYEPPSP
jgi:3-ketosteroid 9alpha-monooxygenase subunit A